MRRGRPVVRRAALASGHAALPAALSMLALSLLAAAPLRADAAPAAPASRASSSPAARASSPPPANIDAESEPIIRAMTDAMGGQAAWDAQPCFRFDFVAVKEGKELARFRHWWDKRRGRCRVEGPDDAGKHVTAIFTLADKKGIAFSDGIGVSDPAETAKIIENGYERWVNDTYWVIMPFKLHDPGVRVRYARPERTASARYDVLELSFMPGTGLTSSDHYWLFVNRATHLIDRWEFVLTGRKPPPEGSSWEAWSRVGPFLLSLQRRIQGRPVMLRFENASTPQAFDETVFTYSSVRD